MRWIAFAALAAGCSQVFGLDPPKLAYDAAHDTRSIDAFGCTTHAQCGSPGACLPDGTCGTNANVAWVAKTGSDFGTCTQAAPCATITHALAQNRPYVKVATGTITDQVTIAQNVTILADAGAALASPMDGAIITVTGTAVVEVHDLRITGGTSTGVAVGAVDSPTLTLVHVMVDSNAGVGLNIGGGSLTMSRCIVSGNVLGGATISSAFDITNSLFVLNGSGTSTTGGLTLDAPSAQSSLSFDTIADNASSTGTAAARGINCSVPLAVRDVIVSNNEASANCTFEYSLFSSGTASGTNRVGAPAFKNTSSTNPTASDFYRIGPASAAIDGADPASALAFDIDLVPRPQGVTFDIGASEYKQ